jgi:hypothetical protein
MQGLRAAVAGLLLANAVVVADAFSFEGNPIRRVVDLLNGLSKTVEEEGKAEEKLYKQFRCWGKTNIDAKTASNVAATTRADELKSYIADIEAGKIEFTTERVDLEKEIAGLTKDLEEAEALRTQEAADYESAKAELKQGIAALKEAVLVLKEGTAEPSMLLVKTSLRAGALLAHKAEVAVKHIKAVELADRVLSKGDAMFLRRVLNGDVPKADWKKLNRKATFKKGYEARSGKIQDTLAQLLQTFETNLEEATTKEDEAQAQYDTLHGAKTEQKTKAEEALTSMEAEGGARNMNKAEAQAEVDELEQQVADDTVYIEQITNTLKDKEEEFSARSTLRASELEAISKAVGILHSDDARDLFKKSYNSQGYSFVELHHKKSRRHHTKKGEKRGLAAAHTLHRAAKHDARLRALAARVAAVSTGHFDEVLVKIDEMVAMLQEEEHTELEQKEMCEHDRNADTRNVIVASRTADELTDEKTRLEAEIVEVVAEIKDKDAQIVVIDEELADAKKIREDEAAAYASTHADDTAAVGLVEKAHEVLGKFYANNAFVQSAKKQPSAAGAAPPPPPSTWDMGAGQTKQGESTSILAILEMIKGDIEKDISKATAAEDDAIAAYDAMKTDLENQIADLEALITSLEEAKADKETDIQSIQEEHTAQVEEVKTSMEKIAAYQGGCDFILVNHPMRTENRHIEIDGLNKAKAILKGAAFSAPADPNREIKPGDA